MGLNNNVLHTIRQQMPQFSKGQKRIAAYILEHYDKAAFMTASRLGQTVEVSESTVVRFAAQLGYEGYPEMQRDLRELIRGKLTSIQRIQVSNDQMQGDLLTSVMQRDMDSLRTAIEQVDRGQFEQMVDKLLKAQHIYLLGMRSSSFLTGYLNFYFRLIFKNVTLVQNAVAGETFEQLVQVQPGDVLLAISFPRYSKMTVNAVQYAREKGADVVAITDSTLAPLYPLASAALLVRSDMIGGSGAVSGGSEGYGHRGHPQRHPLSAPGGVGGHPAGVGAHRQGENQGRGESGPHREEAAKRELRVQGPGGRGQCRAGEG